MCFMCCYYQFLTQSEAVVNAGPAVFISPSGPNPIMVQAMFSPIKISVQKTFFFPLKKKKKALFLLVKNFILF